MARPWRRQRAALWQLVLSLALLSCSLAGTSSAASPVRPNVTSARCGTLRRVPSYHHVVWILMENEGYTNIIGSPAAPYLNGLAASCGLASNYAAVSHPSLPNYIALTSGSTQGITDDAEPSAHRLSVASVFSELAGDWRALEESMPENCDKVTSGDYAARHNPAVYYTDLTTTCPKDDIPLRQPLNLSAAFTFITPNICDDMHSCPVATGDAWLSRFVPRILNSAPYRANMTVLFITFDEGTTASNTVPTFVIAPSVPRALRVASAYTHYSLLRTTEQLLRLAPFGAAARAPSMLAAFHL
ncbi:MAG: alkaline phosphatase family protein [Acidimicrobiales bacterium]